MFVDYSELRNLEHDLRMLCGTISLVVKILGIQQYYSMAERDLISELARGSSTDRDIAEVL